MYVCPYCGTARHELRVCCGEVHSEECSEQAIEHAELTGGDAALIQEDFDAFVVRMENERALTDNGEGP